MCLSVRLLFLQPTRSPSRGSLHAPSPPVLISADILRKNEALDRMCKPIATRPAPPKPVAVPTPKPAAPESEPAPMESEPAMPELVAEEVVDAAAPAADIAMEV
ncbi:MAG: hypothetical protein WDW38_011433 [Sanguina aurantia]